MSKKMATMELELSEKNFKRLQKYAKKQHQSFDTYIERAIRAELKRQHRGIGELCPKCGKSGTIFYQEEYDKFLCVKKWGGCGRWFQNRHQQVRKPKEKCEALFIGGRPKDYKKQRWGFSAKKCPDCALPVLANEEFCRFCNHRLKIAGAGGDPTASSNSAGGGGRPQARPAISGDE